MKKATILRTEKPRLVQYLTGLCLALIYAHFRADHLQKEYSTLKKKGQIFL